MNSQAAFSDLSEACRAPDFRWPTGESGMWMSASAAHRRPFATWRRTEFAYLLRDIHQVPEYVSFINKYLDEVDQLVGNREGGMRRPDRLPLYLVARRDGADALRRRAQLSTPSTRCEERQGALPSPIQRPVCGKSTGTSTALTATSRPCKKWQRQPTSRRA